MKKILSSPTIWILFFAGCIILAGPGLARAAQREWLILVYVSGNNDRGLIGSAADLINQLEKVGSTDRVTVVVKYSMIGKDKHGQIQFQGKVRTLLIKADHGNPQITSPVIDTQPGLGMADTWSLSIFVRKNMVRYPSKKVMLVLWGKGEGFRGVARDDISRKQMGIKDLAKTLSKIRKETGKKIDIFATDADLMQMAAVVYELKDDADFIVGPEGPVSGPAYRYDLMLKQVVHDPMMAPQELADVMVRFGESAVSSAVRADKMEAFVRLLDQWVTAMMSDKQAMEAAAAAADKAFSFPMMRDSKDLCDYIDRVTGLLPPDAPAGKAGNDLKNFIRKEVLLAAHRTTFESKAAQAGSTAYQRAHGLAIYLPPFSYDARAYEPLAFTARSRWRDFIGALQEVKMQSERIPRSLLRG